MESKKTQKKVTVAIYFSLKAKRNNAELNNLSREEILNLSLVKMPQQAFFQAVKSVNTKYNSEVNAKALYKIKAAFLFSEMDTLFEEYPRLHKKQVIRLFENMASAKKEINISSSALPAPLTIDIVNWLSNYTNRELIYANIERALDEGKTITVEDIADYFSAREGRKIAEILARISRPQKSRETVKSFLADCCGKAPEDINEGDLITTMAPSLGSCGGKDYFLVVYWAEAHFNKTASNRFVETKTIGELITFLAQ